MQDTSASFRFSTDDLLDAARAKAVRELDLLARKPGRRDAGISAEQSKRVALAWFVLFQHLRHVGTRTKLSAECLMRARIFQNDD
jgi:hypothetical protein